MLKNLSQKIKNFRVENKLSQDEIAKKLKMSRPTYIQVEKGNRELTISEAQKLAQFFGVSLEDFLADKKSSSIKIKLEKSTKQLKKKRGAEIRISVPEEKVKKFKEVLLYILERIGARPNIGEAVVCKLMYFIDFDYYEKFEEQLIGAKYIKNHFGPTPIAFVKIVKEMEKDGDLAPVIKKYFQHEQKKYLPLRKSNLSNFSAREKELIDWEIERFKDFNATKIKEYSHKDVPWIGANDLEMIDYEAVFSRTDEFSVRQYSDEL